MKSDDANYIRGFTDGEGSFNVSFIMRNDYKHRVKINASFNISQKEKSILVWIQKLFGCGTIRARGDGVYYYEVTDIASLCGIIIPFFEQYPLRTKKKHVFSVFAQIVLMLANKQHLAKEGALKIYDLREQIQVARKRKYSRKDVEKALEAQK